MIQEVKVYYVDENINTEEIESHLKNGFGVLPTNNQKLLILVKSTAPKIAK